MTTIAKEKPIIFTGHSVPAILRGQKTMTRRAIKPQPQESFSEDFGPDGETTKRRSYGFVWEPRADGAWFNVEHPSILRACPYGAPGDRLYAKESWSPDHAAFYPNFPVVYRADNCVGDIENGKVYSPEVDAHFSFKWRSPLFMPRHLSRLTIEITEVRVERLQSITEEDAKAEGFQPWTHRTEGVYTALWQFREAWERLNAKRGFSWESNPWLWALTFRRLEAS